MVHDAGAATRADIRALQSELSVLREGLREYAERATEAVSRAEHVATRVEEIDARLRALEGRVDGLHGVQGNAHESLVAAENLVAIDAFGRFLATAFVPAGPLVSVVLPTYNRPQTLGRAIASVLAQRYENWELIVVDDGGETDVGAIVAQFADGRIHWTRREHRGVCAARNTALAHVRGEIVAYLDDDNVMDPGWLHAVAWTFSHRRECDVLYGAIVIDDVLRVDGRSSGHFPRTYLHPFSRDVLRTHNLADMGTIAHRSGLPEARFDESLLQAGDWDLLVRLTADRDPVVVPAVACHYMSDAPDRLTLGPTRDADCAAVRALAAALNP